jgi:hypothetical protein
MLGFANFLSGNLGDFEAGCGFKLSPNGVACDSADCKVSTKVRLGQFSLLQPLAMPDTEFSGPHTHALPRRIGKPLEQFPHQCIVSLATLSGGVMVAFISFVVVTFASNLTSRSLKEDCLCDCPCDCHPPFVLHWLP